MSETPADDTDLDRQLLIEQYKTYVEAAESTSARRLTTNTFFLTLHTAVLTGAGYTIHEASGLKGSLLVIACGIAGILLCWVWSCMLNAYRRINRCKFRVIGMLEGELPASPFWKLEWSLLSHDQHPNETEDEYKKRQQTYAYTPLTAVEARVPIIVIGAYVLVMCLSGFLLISSSAKPAADDTPEPNAQPLEVRVEP